MVSMCFSNMTSLYLLYSSQFGNSKDSLPNSLSLQLSVEDCHDVQVVQEASCAATFDQVMHETVQHHNQVRPTLDGS